MRPACATRPVFASAALRDTRAARFDADGWAHSSAAGGESHRGPGIVLLEDLGFVPALEGSGVRPGRCKVCTLDN